MKMKNWSVLQPLALVILYIVAAAQLSASAQSDMARVRDLAYLMGASNAVPSFAAYCEKFVNKSSEANEAVKRWNERHSKAVEAIVREFKRLEMPLDQKREMEEAGSKMLSKEIEEQPDKVGYCLIFAKTLDAGDWDFDRRPDVAGPLSRLGISAK